MENITLPMLYQKLQSIEQEVKEINDDLHRIKPEFVEEIKKVEKGKFFTLKNVEEMEKHMDEQMD